MVAVRALAFAAGFVFALATLFSAVWTVVIPRGERVRITSAVFAFMRRSFEWRAARVKTFDHKDRILARFAPISLILLPGVWAVGILLGFIPMFWALGVDSWRDAVELSGSSLLTLGFERTDEFPTIVLSFVEALLGLGIVALLISYLPTIYGHFSRREAQVAKQESRAGSPPTPKAMLIRAHSLGQLDNLHATWTEWEDWFVALEESHTSFSALCFFRSLQPNRSWIISAGAVSRYGVVHSLYGRCRGVLPCAAHDPRRLPGAPPHRRLLQRRVRPEPPPRRPHLDPPGRVRCPV